MSSRDIIYKALDTGRHEIRLVTVQPQVGQTQTIQCTLEIVSLQDQPDFEALSYRWGDPNVTEPIELCGHQFPVTASLAAAFRHFRSHAQGQPFQIWADAICINQGDNRERSHQVLLMDKIYKSASNVRIWIGDMEDSCKETGFTMLGWLAETGKKKELPGVFQYTPFKERKRRWRLLRKFFENGYWHRAWIVQEIVLARSTTLYCGDMSLNIPDWLSVQHYLLNAIPADADPQPESWSTAESMYHEMCRENVAVRDGIHKAISRIAAGNAMAAKAPMDMSRSLALLRGAEASQGIDCLYAMLSFLDVDGLDFFPDYEKDPDTVFEEFSFEYMKATKSLSLLYHTSDQNSSLPSWALDFRLKGNMHVTYPERFDASAGTAFRISRPFPGALVVPGLIITQIGSISEKKVDKPDTNDKFTIMLAISEMMKNPKEHFDNKPSRLKYMQVIDVLPPEDWNRFSQNPTTQGQSNELYSMRSDFWYIVGADGSEGLASEGVQKDDLVCVLASQSMPMCIRQVPGNERRYKVVGCAYVDGIMYGQTVKRAANGDESLFNNVFEDIYLV